MKHPRRFARSSAVALLFLGACMAAPEGSAPRANKRAGPAVAADLAISRAPFHEVAVNWKQRLDQPYVYLEGRGSYTQIGELLEQVDRAMSEQRIQPAGPPFGLFYDDPGKVAVEQLRMRACFPVLGTPDTGSRLAYSVLESTTVVYAFVGGPYPEVPRAYPGMFDFMRKLNWVEDGPIREIYLVNPAAGSDWSQLVCEVQIPAASAP